MFLNKNMFVFIFSLFVLVCCEKHYLEANTHTESVQWQINTSNPGKLQEFQRLFAKYDITLLSTQFDLDEIESDPVTVVAHKASQLGDLILVEDTSLDIEGASVGINVRWLIDHLDEYIGRKAVWRVLLAYHQADEVFIYKGEVQGIIVPARGKQGFGFDPVFLPEGSHQTLAESKPDEVNARALAVDALVNSDLFTVVDAIYQWDGPWQEN